MRDRYGLATRPETQHSLASSAPSDPRLEPEAVAVPLATATARTQEPMKSSVGSAAPPEEPPPDWSAFFIRQQLARRNLNAPPDVALQSFKVEQRGQVLRVLDADGSIYRGIVTSDSGRAAEVSPGRTAFTGGELPPGSLNFQVTGTNRTTRQTLLFQGLIATGGTARLQAHALIGGRDRVVVEAVERRP
jgi:hypothetical protein